MSNNDDFCQASEHYRDASQRFEYFIVGVLVALVAYAGQTLRAQKLGLNAYTLQVIGILMILAAIVISFKRLEKLISALQINLLLLESRERRALYTKFLIEGGNR